MDSVNIATRHFLLKSAILRCSMNDALITRVTGEKRANASRRD
ncbi:hypothetical protein ACLB1T_09285 [Escherichia coli]